MILKNFNVTVSTSYLIYALCQPLLFIMILKCLYFYLMCYFCHDIPLSRPFKGWGEGYLFPFPRK